jgi:hypothetical protein
LSSPWSTRVVLSAAAAAVLCPTASKPNDQLRRRHRPRHARRRTETGLSIHAANNYDYYKFKAARLGPPCP